MPWLTAEQACARLGIQASALRTRGRKGQIKRKPHGLRTFLYWVDDDAPEANDVVPKQGTDLADVQHDNDGGGNYYEFHEDRDKYIFMLRSKGHAPYAVDGAIVRGMLRAYSNDGAAASINRVCMTHGWTRATARDVLRALGKTHDSAPFTDEEIASREENDLADDLIRLKEERVIHKANKADWDRTKKLAEEARRLDQFFLKRIEAIIAAGEWSPPAQAPAVHIEREKNTADTSVVFGLTDAHVGAHAWAAECGEDNNLEIVRERTLATTKRLIERVCGFRSPSRWLLPSGSDNIHADTRGKTTTKGTPLDTDGSHARMFMAACSLYEELVAMLLPVAPVEIVAMPGNHDASTTVFLTHWLAGRFRDEQYVRVGPPTEERAYRLHGKVLLCMTHGEKIKPASIPLVMASEVPHLWGLAKHRYVLSGHWHSNIVHELNGTQVIHMPTLAREDQWAYGQGYTKNVKAISAYVFDHEEGLVATLPVQPPSTP